MLNDRIDKPVRTDDRPCDCFRKAAWDRLHTDGILRPGAREQKARENKGKKCTFLHGALTVLPRGPHAAAHGNFELRIHHRAAAAAAASRACSSCECPVASRAPPKQQSGERHFAGEAGIGSCQHVRYPGCCKDHVRHDANVDGEPICRHAAGQWPELGFAKFADLWYEVEWFAGQPAAPECIVKPRTASTTGSPVACLDKCRHGSSGGPASGLAEWPAVVVDWVGEHKPASTESGQPGTHISDGVAH